VSATLTAIGITSRDIAESVRFYRTLGVEVPDPAADAQHHETALPSGLRLMWDTLELMRQLDPDREEPRGHRLALAFECGSPADVDETYRRLVDEGFEGKKEPYDAFWGQRYANVVDPDGNVVDLFASLPQ
jgi:catechol 2,3-dioxygenase-like lactoylglutathione lyase family enzyme